MRPIVFALLAALILLPHAANSASLYVGGGAHLPFYSGNIPIKAFLSRSEDIYYIQNRPVGIGSASYFSSGVSAVLGLEQFIFETFGVEIRQSSYQLKNIFDTDRSPARKSFSETSLLLTIISQEFSISRQTVLYYRAGAGVSSASGNNLNYRGNSLLAGIDFAAKPDRHVVSPHRFFVEYFYSDLDSGAFAATDAMGQAVQLGERNIIRHVIFGYRYHFNY